MTFTGMLALSNTYTFNTSTVGTLVLDASLLHLTQTRNSDLGFALAFPFSSTALTISGFETLWRQPIRDSHHFVPRPAQSAEIPVPLRPEPHCEYPFAQVRSRLHSRTGAERSVSRQRPRRLPSTSITRPITYRTPARSEPSLRSVSTSIRRMAQPARSLLPATETFRRTFSAWLCTLRIPGE